MAPEMIQGGRHNHTLDIWCLGILLYEMLHGHAPFRGKEYGSMKELIMRGKIKFKKGLPDDIKDLIFAMLKRDANERIPLIMVFNHPWILRLSEKHQLKR
jgi:serine/threonine protein kinase